jgi:hypothetical protein
MVPHAYCDHCFRRVPVSTLKWVRTHGRFERWCEICGPDREDDVERSRDWR